MIIERKYIRYATILFPAFALSLAGASQRCRTASECITEAGTAELQGLQSRCDDGFFFDPGTKACRRKEPRTRKRRNTSGEDPGNTVGGSCLSADNCLDGLVCTNVACECPEGCTYDAGLQACHCGADEFSSLPLIIVAVVWAPINIFIWYKCFKAARKGRENKRRTEDGEESPSKLALHSTPPPPPIVVESSHTVADTRAASTQLAAPTAPGPDLMSSGSANSPMHRPVFVVSTDETDLPIDPRQPGIFTPPGPSRVHARSAAWNESPRVN